MEEEMDYLELVVELGDYFDVDEFTELFSKAVARELIYEFTCEVLCEYYEMVFALPGSSEVWELMGLK